ncbi:hypothetical protein BG015_005806 [Linnemannia schmuckeri]|uniref:Amino acid transporter transmembrane domain-containing protein n=1 Tax=Linnemannia schmuckeri TaxID=64567 RepID=A0A9P5S6J5_9FUNG|nr:hypothetical protein BG015_005806 [Linnemannia schmuckeri]
MSSAETTPLLSNASLYDVTKQALTGHHYKPDLLAERPEQGSSFAVYAVVVCIVAGSGTLGLPYALKLGGWIGVGVVILSLLMSIYTSVLLVRCLYYDGVQRLSSYQEVGRHAFGKAGLWTVWFFYATTVIGAPVMFLILAGTGLKAVSTLDISVKMWIWICATIVAIPFVLIKTMKEAAITSVLGALATVVLVIVAVRGSIVDLDNPVYADVNHSFVIFSHLPTAIASISMCFGGNAIYIHVEESMRYPKSWNRVVAAALCTCTVFYLTVAIPGYMAYGDLAESPILNNLPKDSFTTLGTVVIIVHVLLTAPLLLTSFALEIERLANITVSSRGQVMERVYRTVLRLVIVGVCACIACTVPYFGDFLSLLGALSNCTLIFVLPVVFYAKLVGWRQMGWLELIWCMIIIVIGVVSAIIGSIDAIQALKEDFENDPSII